MSAMPRTKKAKSDAAEIRSRRKNKGWFTSETGRRARRRVSPESCAENGRLGAIATINKHGWGAFFRGWRRWKLENPSKPERLMIGILATLKVSYEREWQIGKSRFSLDFYLKRVNGAKLGMKLAIEVHGNIHKTLDAEKKAENDVIKRDLSKELGIEVLWIEEDDFKDLDRLIVRVRKFIARAEKRH